MNHFACKTFDEKQNVMRTMSNDCFTTKKNPEKCAHKNWRMRTQNRGREKKTPTNGSKFNRKHTHARARAHTRIHNTNSVIMVYF